MLLGWPGWFTGTAQAQDGVVTGRVLRADGSPAADLQVAIVGLDIDGRVAFLGRPFRAGRANADGVFRISTELTVRGAGGGVFWYANSVIPIPSAGVDSFQFPLPEGDYRVAPAGQPATPGLYVEALSYGEADLSRERMILRSNRLDELVITLAVCPDGTDSPCN